MRASVRVYELVVIFFAISAITGGLPKSANAQVNLGYVDSNKILERCKEARDAKEELDKVVSAWDTEVGQMLSELKKQERALEVDKPLLSGAAIKQRKGAIKNLASQLEQFQEEKFGPQGEVYQKNAAMMKPIIDKIKATIQRIGTERHFDYIFDLAAGNILHVGEGQTNLTEIVVNEMNKL